ncbi:hypothetical protein IEQ34_026542 [Dendrobium chrysotoxum]|uniref:K Homology domain-containing protein n=1 Tax=Dendrobium chrysotoxum TaxID=161865 RepID=A0AAV7FL90_DENCH|nr:hypothetical protein IEQ34_026542 [Dendrobium chrysotoxum]
MRKDQEVKILVEEEEMPPLELIPRRGMGEEGFCLFDSPKDIEFQPDNIAHGTISARSLQETNDVQGNSTTLGVPDEHIGAVVGRGGRNILEITQISGAKIKISDRGDFMSGTSDRKVTITGTPEAIRTAEAMIMQRVYASTYAFAFKDSFKFVSLSIQEKLKNGENTKEQTAQRHMRKHYRRAPFNTTEASLLDCSAKLYVCKHCNGITASTAAFEVPLHRKISLAALGSRENECCSATRDGSNLRRSVAVLCQSTVIAVYQHRSAIRSNVAVLFPL